MSTRLTALVLAAVTLAACSGGGAATNQPTGAATSKPTAAATQGSGGGPGATELDPNTVAGFCKIMTDTIAKNWPPRDSAAAFLISPFFRAWAAVDSFKDISTDLLAVADWTASASIMNPVPAVPADVKAAYDKITAFAGTHC